MQYHLQLHRACSSSSSTLQVITHPFPIPGRPFSALKQRLVSSTMTAPPTCKTTTPGPSLQTPCRCLQPTLGRTDQTTTSLVPPQIHKRRALTQGSLKRASWAKLAGFRIRCRHLLNCGARALRLPFIPTTCACRCPPAWWHPPSPYTVAVPLDNRCLFDAEHPPSPSAVIVRVVSRNAPAWQRCGTSPLKSPPPHPEKGVEGFSKAQG